MRVLAAIWAVLGSAGCQALFGIAEVAPQDARGTASDARIRDGQVDGGVDAALGLCGAAAMFATTTKTGTVGGSFTVTPAHRALISGTEVIVDNIIDLSLDGNFAAAALSPDQDQLFLYGTPSTAGAALGAYRSTFDPTFGSWSTPVPLSNGSTGFIGVAPTAPTSSTWGNRHMMTVIAQTDLVELEEDAPDQWTALSAVSVTTFTGLSSTSYAMLTADGLHVLMSAYTEQMTLGIYLASRDSIDQPFPAQTPVALRDISEPDLTPYLTPDCSALYYSYSGDVYEMQ